MIKVGFQRLGKSALEKEPASFAVRAFGIIAGWTCFGSKSTGLAHNTGSRVSTKCSSLSSSTAMTFSKMFSQDIGLAYFRIFVLLFVQYNLQYLDSISV